MNMLTPRSLSQDVDFLGSMTTAKQGVVVVVSDDPATIEISRRYATSWN